MDLFEKKDFTTKSGVDLDWKIECDALTSGDIETIAWLLSEITDDYRDVIGVPDGGLALAREMKQYATGNDDNPLMIVDDVWTTGRSMHALRGELRPWRDVIGAVIFARHQPAQWVYPLFFLNGFGSLREKPAVDASFEALYPKP